MGAEGLVHESAGNRGKEADPILVEVGFVDTYDAIFCFCSGAETEYRIVGVDETDLDQNWISFFSPIARALMNQSLGAHVRFRIPAGEQSLEILSISYIS